MLGASGVSVSPDDLTDDVYVPGRKGSFQVELAAAARRYGRIPYRIPPSLDDLHSELAAGRPVLVLQNLAFGWAPSWHYAVVVGMEAEPSRVVLRSGRTARRLERLAAFDRTWALAERWGLVLLRPGELPASAGPRAYLEAVVAATGSLSGADQAAALAAGIHAWPEDADLTFAAANTARGGGDERRAADLYRRTLALSADHAGALNNLADLLSAQGCQRAALALVEQGLQTTGQRPAIYDVMRQTRAEILARSNAELPEPAGCAGQ